MSIDIVGLGVGNLDYLTGIGIKILTESEIIIGGKRQIDSIEKLIKTQEIYELKKLSDMVEFTKENIHRKICFIVSGDTGFYSLTSFLKNNFIKEIKNIIPGISSFQYLFSKIGEQWEDYTLVSLHGKSDEIVQKLEDSKAGLIVLTDSKNSPSAIGKKLLENNIENIDIIIGENLSYENEKIEIHSIKNIEEYSRNYDINVVVLKKVGYAHR